MADANSLFLNDAVSQNAVARQLNQSKIGQGEENDESSSLRERQVAARLKEGAKKLVAKAAAPAKAATSELLKQSWINLIDSFGLTLIWINIHVFLKWVLGDTFFCKLGEEWVPKQASAAAGENEAVKSATGMAGIVEVMLLILLDFIIAATILLIVAVIAMIVDFWTASLFGKIERLWNLGLAELGIFKALIDLFL